MKKLIAILFSILFIGQAISQDPGYAGPAKVQVKMFWAQIEKLKAGTATASTISNAERAIKMVKENDPSYNTADMEAAVKPWKEKADKEKGDKQSAVAKADEERQYFKEIWAKMVSVYSTGRDIEPGVVGKAYFDRVTALNLDEYKEKRKALGEVDPKSYAGLIDAKLADYDNYLERSERLKWNVVQPMTESRNASNPQKKMDILEQVKYECQAVLILSPDNAAFKQKLEEVNKLMGSAAGEASKFYTSDFHKQHLNQVVWSSKPLVIGKENEMASFIKTGFKSGDYIYGTAYLGIMASDAMNNNTNLRVRIRVDGGTAIWGGDLSYIELPVSAQGRSYIQFALLPDAQWLKDNYAPYIQEENWTLSYLLDELARSGDISHEITCELIFPTSKIRDIKSAFSLDLGSGSEAIKALSGKLHNELMASRQLPKAGMNNLALEKQMLATMQKLPGWNETFSKAVITSSGWTIKKNDLTGVILYRYIGVIGACTDAQGKCYYQEFTFRQDYAGGGNYESTAKYNSYGSKREIGCDKIK
ncbi:MAG: hypothetical protein IPI66_09640 [Chitinophagaceae bacterium]|nr:hypothetical protein [Chitinophagaceae bacterium]